MKRQVTAPNGTEYEVVLDWFGRRLRNPVDVGRERAGRVWSANPFSPRLKGKQEPRPGASTDEQGRTTSSWAPDVIDCCDPIGDVGGFGILLALAGAALLLLALLVGAPLLAAVLSVVAESLVLVVIAAVVLAWRVAARRPWRILVTTAEGRSWSREQHGWRRSRAEVTRIAEALRTGADPTWLQLTPRPRRA